MKIFKKRWFWTLIICLLLMVGLWFAIPTMHIRLLAIGAVVILWCVINLDLTIGLARNKKSASSHENDAASPTDVTVEDDAFMKGQMLEARYRTTKLPGFLVIGSAGAGKTSLLAQANLQYPLPEQAPSASKPHADDQWWFSQQAVFIENKNAFTEKARWEKLLGQLKKYASRRRLNGIIVCIDVAELLNVTADHTQDTAVYLRHLLVEFNQQLALSTPIYLTFTQCDRIFGFNEFFTELPAQKRQQAFGISIAYNKVKDNLNTFLTQELKQLFTPLQNNVLEKLHASVGQNRALFTLPEQLSILRSSLGDFISKLVADDGYHHPIPLRGIYFTSAIKAGTPIYPQLATQAELPNQTIATTRQPETESLFIPGLLQQVIKESQKLTHPNVKAQTSRQLTHIWYYGACSAILLAAAFFWNQSYQRNHSRLNQVESQANQYQTLFAKRTGLINQLQLITALQNDVNQKDHWPMKLGLSVRNHLQPPIGQAYAMINHYYFNPLMQRLLEQSLQADQGERLYHSLMVYLMLGDSQYFSATTVQNWLRNNPLEKYQALIKEYPQLQPLLIQYYGQFSQPLKLNQTLIAQAREKLTQASSAQRIYWALQKQLENQPQENIAANDLQGFNEVFTLSSNALKIPALYTKSGLNEQYPKQSTADIANAMKTNWVLNDNKTTTTVSPKLVAKQLQTLYLNDYVNYWQNLFNHLHIREFSNLNQAVKIVTVLAKANSPMYQALSALNDNTTIKAATLGKTKKTLPLTPLQADAQKRFDDNFASLNALLTHQGTASPAYSKIQTTLQALATTLTNIQQASNPTQAAFEFAKKRFTQPGADAISKIYQLAIAQPQPVKSWLVQIAQNSWQVIMNLTTQYVDNTWQQQLAPTYERSIANRYPLVKSSPATITLNDFSTFFAPGGKLDVFTQTYLAPFYQTQNLSWQAKPLNDQTLHVSPSLIKLLQQAQQLRQQFFANGSKKLQLGFSLKPLNLDATAASFTLTINSKTLTYQHGPERYDTFTWPGTEGSDQITVHFVDLNGKQFSQHFSGPWALFKWLEKNTVVAEPDGSNYQLHVKLDGHTAVLMLHADSTNNPFYFNKQVHVVTTAAANADIPEPRLQNVTRAQ